jgi:hypothetical protein
LRRPDQARTRTTGGEIGLQEDQLGRPAPFDASPAPEPRPRRGGKPPGRRAVVACQGAARPVELDGGQVLGEPVAPEDDRRGGERVVGLANQSGLDQHLGPALHHDCRRRGRVQVDRRVHQAQRFGEVARHELHVAQVVSGHPLQKRQPGRRGLVRTPAQVVAGRPQIGQIHVRDRAVEQHEAALVRRRVARERGRGVEFLHRVGRQTGPQRDESPLVLQGDANLGQPVFVDRRRGQSEPGPGVGQTPELELGVGQRDVDAGEQFRAIAVGRRRLQQGERGGEYPFGLARLAHAHELSPPRLVTAGGLESIHLDGHARRL